MPIPTALPAVPNIALPQPAGIRQSLALSETGTILAADDMAVSLLSVPNRASLIGHHVGELFDIGEPELQQMATARQALLPVRDIRLGRRFFATLAQPQFLSRLPSSSASSTVISADRVHITPGVEQKNALTLSDLAGQDPQMLRNIRNATRLANSRVPILIQGPTGSGKEVFAKAVHNASARANKPFVAVNCAAIPETLIESELFGYKAGAFTGARKEGMRGRIQQACGGTLFLDEIGDMPLSLQTRLLRVLEEQEVAPLGSEISIKVELFVISASHRALGEMVARGEFREDLFYRLNGMVLELPALRERGDIEQLIRRFIALEAHGLAHSIEIENDAFERLLSYAWPGNIRELRNVIRTALAISENGVIRISDLPRSLQNSIPGGARQPATPALVAESSGGAVALPAPTAAPSSNALEAAERLALLRAVENNHWNMTLTARDLGMSRNTLYRKLRRHNISLDDGRRSSVSRM